MPSILFSLLRELRDQIYEHILFSQIPRTVDLVPVLKPTEDGKLATSILRVNKQTHEEASRVLYSNTTLVLPIRYIFRPDDIQERTRAYTIFRTPPPLEQAEALTSEVQATPTDSFELVPCPAVPGGQCADGLIYEHVLRKVANIRYLMACFVDDLTETPTGIHNVYGCSLHDAIQVITSLCADDPSDEKPFPKSFQLEVFSQNPHDTAEETTKMKALTFKTVEAKGLEGPLGELRKYRKVGMELYVFYPLVDGREVLHERIKHIWSEWGGYRDMPPERLGPGHDAW